MSDWTVLHGDNVEAMAGMEAETVDAFVTDPPYGINFMGKAWDGAHIERDAAKDAERRTLPDDEAKHGRKRTVSGSGTAASVAGAYDFSLKGNRAFQVWTERWAQCAFRLLKPGGHLLSFSSPRTYHRMAAGIEDAGFEIRDALMWMYGSGMPKSHDVAKAIDKKLGAEPTVVGKARGVKRPGFAGETYDKPRGKLGGVYEGGAMPVDYDLTVATTEEAAQWEGWGTALKPAWEPVVVARKPLAGTVAENVLAHGTGAINVDGSLVGAGSRAVERPKGATDGATSFGKSATVSRVVPGGRWPANVLLTHHPDCEGAGSTQTLVLCHPDCPLRRLDEQADASRFFYSGKVDRRERIAGTLTNLHPTVKPIDLMRWLCRLVTPPGGLIIDPFLGSGSTGVACVLEGFRFVGIECEDEYVEIARSRIADYAFVKSGSK